MSTCRFDSDGEGAVEAAQVRGQRDDGTDAERPADGHEAAEPVDERRRERREQAQRGHEHA